jgi:hypothetical protein
MQAAKRYLRELRALCDEAIQSRDERVLALAVVSDQRRTVAQLRRVVALCEVGQDDGR